MRAFLSTSTRHRNLTLIAALCGFLPITVTMANDTEPVFSYTEPPLSETDRDHWSFQSRQSIDVPQSKNPDWCRNPVDQFVATRLETSGLVPQPPASRQTPIRRVTLNLTGLPPSPEETAAFETDASPTAYSDLVERLLASTAYGEHMAQPWLDIARFAETDGFEHDRLRKDAWKYRDWVINAFNADLPYDQFVRMQIAGDLLEPDNAAAHVATHFCVAGPDMPDINSQEERRHTLLNELTATVGEVFLGLQIGCAECHDHKYDPISQADFYRMRSIFESAISLKKNVSVGTLAETWPYQKASHVMIRGDFRKPGPEIQPGVLRLFAAVNDGESASSSSGSDRSLSVQGSSRMALANWLTDLRHPLTARVAVNRLWQLHFGTGLVDTPGDFGIMGQPPVNQELLDWLANWFVAHNWSVRQFHRLIVTSATYQQRSLLPPDSSDADVSDWERALVADPDARLLSRFPRRRLSGEVLRDVMLAVSDSLNRKPGGPGIRPPLPQELRSTLLKDQWEVTADESEHNRRSIYLFARRNLRFPIFEAFDRPPANDSCPGRTTSSTAPQALFLLNSEFSLTCSEQLATAIRQSASSSDAQVTAAFRRVLNRDPAADERTQVHAFLKESGDAQGMSQLCLALFNTNEFLWVD